MVLLAAIVRGADIRLVAHGVIMIAKMADLVGSPARDKRGAMRRWSSLTVMSPPWGPAGSPWGSSMRQRCSSPRCSSRSVGAGISMSAPGSGLARHSREPRIRADLYALTLALV